MKTAVKVEPAGPMTVDKAVWPDPNRMSGAPWNRKLGGPEEPVRSWPGGTGPARRMTRSGKEVVPHIPGTGIARQVGRTPHAFS